MKTDFYLKPECVIAEKPTLVCWFIIIGIVAMSVYFRSWAIFAILFLPCVILGILCRVFEKLTENTGLYIKDNRIYIKRAFSEKDILSREIAGIKIMHMYSKIRESRSAGSVYIPEYYGDGRAIYVMILLSEISQAMYNYKNNYCYFEDDFREEIIYVAEYDPEAVKYLKTLNPDIKVFY